MADFVVNVRVAGDNLTPQLRAQAAAAKQADQAQKAAAKSAVAGNAASAAAAKKAADAQIKESVRVVRENAKHDAQTAAGKRKLDEQIARMRDRTARDMERQAARDEARDTRVAENKAKREEQANARGAAARSKAEGRALTDDEVAQRVRLARINVANKARVDAARKAAGVEVASNNRIGTSTGGLIGQVKTLAVSYLGLQAAIGLMGELASATKSAADEQKRQTDEFIRYREAQTELAGIRGKVANDAEALKSAEFEARTGMTGPESVEFQSGFENSGAQHKGVKISEGEYEKFMEKAAQLAVAKGTGPKGIDPKILGDLAGNTLALKDYGALGDKAADAALEDLSKAIAVLGQGKGDNAPLAAQLMQASTAMVNEDDMKGIFKNQVEVATALSAIGELNPNDAFMHLRAANKGLRDFEDKDAGPLLAEAKITPQTPFFQAVEQLAPIVQKQAKEQGVKTIDVMQKAFPESRTREGIDALINRGAGPQGAFKQRQDFLAGKTATKYVPGQEFIDKGRSDPTSAVSRRLIDADAARSEATVGQRRALYDSIYKEAETSLRDEGNLNSEALLWGDVFRNKLNPRRMTKITGGVDAMTGRVLVRAREILQNRAAAGGMSIQEGLLQDSGSPEAIQGGFTEAMKDMMKSNINPFSGGKIDKDRNQKPFWELEGKAAPAAPGPQAALGKFGAGMGGLGDMMAASAMGAMPGGIPEVFPSDGFGGGGGGGAGKTNDLLGEIRDMMAENQRYIRMATGGGDRAQAPPPPPAPPRVISAPVGR